MSRLVMTAGRVVGSRSLPLSHGTAEVVPKHRPSSRVKSRMMVKTRAWPGYCNLLCWSDQLGGRERERERETERERERERKREESKSINSQT